MAQENRTRTGHVAVTQQLDSISPSPAHGSGAVVTTMVRWCDQVRVCHVRCPRCGRSDLRERGDDLICTRERHTIFRCVSCRSVWKSWNVRRRSRAPRLPAGGIGVRTTRENGDSQECARELDTGPGFYRTTNATGAWSYHRSLLHVQGCRLQCVSTVAVKGGKVPTDAGSLVASCEHDNRFEESDEIAAPENTQALDQVKIQVVIEDIDCILLAGGHGIFVAFEEGCADIVTRSYAADRL